MSTPTSSKEEKEFGEVQATSVTDQTEVLVSDKFSKFALIGLGYTILNSYTAMAASLGVAIGSGGSSVVVWGIVPSTIGSLASAISLAEILHVYPTTGGQYHFTYILSNDLSNDKSYQNFLSWFDGWLAVAGWISLYATAPSLGSSLVIGLISLNNQDYNTEPWHTFVIYLLFTIGSSLIVLFGDRYLGYVNRFAMMWSLLGASLIAVIVIALNGKREPRFQSPAFVFGGFSNETGWPDGVAWILGLLQSSFGLEGYDGVMHMCDEIPNPSINAPIAMTLAVVIGSVTSFIFLVILLFNITDVDAVISSAAGPLFEAIHQATSSVVGTTALACFPIVSLGFAAQGILTASSRMTHSFAQDGGLPFSPFFARTVDGIPRNAIYLNAMLCVLFGLLNLGSSAAINAILSCSVVFLNISYIIPISILFFRGRKLLDNVGVERKLTLGRFGPAINVVAVLFLSLTTIFFCFPPALPVTGASMNYAVAVLFLIIFASLISYFATGRKTYKGPRSISASLMASKEQ